MSSTQEIFSLATKFRLLSNLLEWENAISIKSSQIFLITLD